MPAALAALRRRVVLVEGVHIQLPPGQRPSLSRLALLAYIQEVQLPHSRTTQSHATVSDALDHFWAML